MRAFLEKVRHCWKKGMTELRTWCQRNCHEEVPAQEWVRQEHSSGCTESVKSPLARQEIKELNVTEIGLFFLDCITILDRISTSRTKHRYRPSVKTLHKSIAPKVRSVRDVHARPHMAQPEHHGSLGVTSSCYSHEYLCMCSAFFSAWLVKEIIFTPLDHCARQYDYPVGLTVCRMNIHYGILPFFEWGICVAEDRRLAPEARSVKNQKKRICNSARGLKLWFWQWWSYFCYSAKVAAEMVLFAMLACLEELVYSTSVSKQTVPSPVCRSENQTARPAQFKGIIVI